MQKKKYEVSKQVYRVKKDGRLNKNSDLILDKEKPTVEETSASSIDQTAPHVEHVSNDMAEQYSSSDRGQDKKKDQQQANRFDRFSDWSNWYADQSDRYSDWFYWCLPWV